MKILGLEKLSLVDFDGHIAATVFTGGCNFRCPFCHNGPLVLDAESQPEIPQEELFDYLKKRKSMLTGVCITGGEPTLHKDLGDFIARLKSIGYKVKLDSNGTNPAMLKTLVRDNLLDYVAMDVKNSPARYGETIGIKNYDLSKINESIDFLKSGAVGYEFRTTLIAEYHTAADIEEIGKWINGAEKYFMQAYKETENCIETGLTKVDENTAESFKSIMQKYVKYVALRGY